jgi:hypothetical protein
MRLAVRGLRRYSSTLAVLIVAVMAKARLARYGGAVKDSVKETVQAVAKLVEAEDAPKNDDGEKYVKSKQLEAALDLDKGAVSRRVKDALDDGYLRDLSTHKNRGRQLVARGPAPGPDRRSAAGARPRSEG